MIEIHYNAQMLLAVHDCVELDKPGVKAIKLSDRKAQTLIQCNRRDDAATDGALIWMEKGQSIEI